MKFQYDIAVAWRIYPGISKKPLICSDSKFELVKTSFLSFLRSVKNLKISYYFILDGCPQEYKKMVEVLFEAEKKLIIETNFIGNLATFAKQIEILCTQNDAELVYFAEDDYLYMPGVFEKIPAFIMSHKDVDFVTCYLHNDIFTHTMHDHERQVKYFNNNLWISCNSTCLTFMTTVETLRRTRQVFLTYCKGNNDCALWLVLTKKHIYDPVIYVKYLFTNRECLGILKRAVKYSFLYFFSLKKYTLWAPYPAIGTHLDSGYQSPGVDWMKVANMNRE